MSVHIIYYKDGAKYMRPVKDETEYRLLRDSQHNRTADKHHMVQMNYSCLPSTTQTGLDNGEGPLKGATRMSRSVGMDIDFDPKAPDYEQKMASVPDLVMGKKDELGLLMLERSANKGYHIAFRRKPELSQEENLGAPDKPCGEAVQTLTQNCCQTIHEEWYVFDSFHLCTEAFDL